MRRRDRADLAHRRTVPVVRHRLFILESPSGLFAECRLCGFGVALSSDDTPEGW